MDYRVSANICGKQENLVTWVLFLTGCCSENYLNLSPLLLEILCSYKAWGALLGRRLAERGIIVACIDYRYVVQTLPY